ncbi:hypothetical protein HRbin16_00659 [bacterium HR16]|nr:hypothetical protein HRbin16_00659 [bacterium HR16]
MNRILLQSMVEAIAETSLPTEWADFDFAAFSASKTLWGYQQHALRNARNALWKYYEDFVDYRQNEPLAVHQQRKERMWQWYLDNALHGDRLAIELPNKPRLASLLREYYETENNRIDYQHFINRMSFWMATGSGKTLVIVKLIELLAQLTGRGEIPPCDILFLTHRDDLLEQLKRHVDEFNARGDLQIILRELREYDAARRETPTLFRGQEATVFYYRSDNLSDEQKEKIVDFRNYENDGRWYLLLDEAHKGDREDSKRQHLYAILSRNGFLFNFSATFTDPRDIATTVYNFNLEHYIQEGYGKHIALLRQEMRAFRDEDDYTGAEKQKIVLKSLMMLAYARKAYQAIQQNRGDRFYHRPLMLVLVNSVNTQDADLELFFQELEKIAREGVADDVWDAARSELLEEFREGVVPEFESGVKANIDEATLQNLSYKDLLQEVFNAPSSAEIEVFIRPSNRQEMAFKLKNADTPFALIKIGDISRWLKEKLPDYEINERFDDEGYFARLNEDDSHINILMGSRTFYEGWDSNRPNVICYINIGVGEDARKFILQSIGRGARIEPLPHKRKRLIPLYNAGEVDKAIFDQLKPYAQPLETLFIFGTNRTALQTVIQELQKERLGAKERRLEGVEVNPAVRARLLLIPVYRKVETPLVSQRVVAKFVIDGEEFKHIKQLAEATDERVLLCLTDATPQQIALLKRSVETPDTYYRFNGTRRGDLLRLLGQTVRYFALSPYETEGLKPLEEEIRHFQQIRVTLEDIASLQEKLNAVRGYPERVQEVRALYGKISPEEYEAKSRGLAANQEFTYDGQKISIKHIAQHYYLPLIVSESERVEFIRHIIRTNSERQFVRALEGVLAQPENAFKELDWWAFSKIDESLDEVFLWYCDPNANRMAKFKPDLIFWLQKGNDYWIVFVDPKGAEHIDWQRKLEGYRVLFEQHGKPREFVHNGYTVRVLLLFYTSDSNRIPTTERDYWFDRVEQLPAKCCGIKS